MNGNSNNYQPARLRAENVYVKRLQAPDEVERYRSQIARWTYDSSPEYFDSLFGNKASACARLETWTPRPDSEYSGYRCIMLLEDKVALGGAVAFGGHELLGRRRADLLHLLKQCSGNERGQLATKLSAWVALTAPVEDTDYYVRVLVIEQHARGNGFGTCLLGECIQHGLALGFSRVRLDVRADNSPAVRLYERAGFKVVREAEMPKNGQRVLSMACRL